MDWQNERYVRVYIRDTVTLTMLGWEARALLWELLRKVDRAGVLDLGGHEPTAAVAAMVGIPLEVVERCLPLLTAGDDPTVVINEAALLLPNHMEAQEATQSNAQRQRESRAKRLAQAHAVTSSHTPSHPVTERDDPSQNVTDCHVQSHAVTSSHSSLAVPNQPSPTNQPSESVNARAHDSGDESGAGDPDAASTAAQRGLEADLAERDGTPGAKWREVLTELRPLTPQPCQPIGAGRIPPPGLVSRLDESSVSEVIATASTFADIVRKDPKAALVPGTKGGGKVVEFWSGGRLFGDKVWASVQALVVTHRLGQSQAGAAQLSDHARTLLEQEDQPDA